MAGSGERPQGSSQRCWRGSGLLADGDDDVRSAAAEALGGIGPSAASAIPDLVKAMADGESYVHSAAYIALDKIDPQWSNIKIRPVPNVLSQ